ncbi:MULTISPECIES: phage major tail protein, TP901-1 family [unclassified Exiguobacterium]|uniref:phage tail tube protein n=1 Tax=unclassified Exiguobacterium TaxID=2644629 RepID=UPI001BE5851D|nr:MULTISPECIES: phage major tail protein, TP901-1 family [unclassified Exiguobacterium]
MEKISGVSVLLSISADGGTTKEVLGGQTGATLNRSTNEIDVTSKDSGGWTENLAGNKSWSVDCDGFLVLDDAAYASLETAWEEGKHIDVDIAYNGKTYEGKALLTDFPSEFPQDDAVSFSLSLSGSGALNRTPVV